MNDLAPLAEALLPLATESPRVHWGERISSAWHQSLLGIIETGRLIAQAKAALPHGEFLDMVESDLPFGPRMAQRLMRIADDPRLADATHVSHLPPRVSTLYLLTGLSDEEFEAKLADGTINPDMERSVLEAPRVAEPMSDAEAGEGAAEPAPLLLFDGQPSESAPEADKPRDHRATMAGRAEPDDSLDFFPTGPWITRALMERVMPHLGVREFGTVWEPACGEGHMAEVLREYFDGVFASDIHDYGYRPAGDVGYAGPESFFDSKACNEDWIITNPPFGDKLDRFISHALDLAQVGVAIFAQVRIAEGINRFETIYRDNPPTLCAFFVERAACVKGKWDAENNSTATAYWWLVWIKDRAPKAPFWIPPGCRESLTKEDDVERFTQHPVRALPANAFVKAEASPAPAWSSPLADDDLEIPAFLRRAAE